MRLLTDLQENSGISGICALERKLHSAANDGETTIEGYQRTTNLLLITQRSEEESDDEDDGVWRDCSKLGDGWVVTESADDSRQATWRTGISVPLLGTQM